MIEETYRDNLYYLDSSEDEDFGEPCETCLECPCVCEEDMYNEETCADE